MTLSMPSRSMLMSGLAAALLGGCLYPEYTEKELAAHSGGAAGKAGSSTRGGSNAGVGGAHNPSGGVAGVSTTTTHVGGAVGSESGSGGIDVAGTDAGGTGGIEDAAGGIGPISTDAGGAGGVDGGSGGIGTTLTDAGGIAGGTAGGNEGFGGIGGTSTSGGGAGLGGIGGIAGTSMILGGAGGGGGSSTDFAGAAGCGSNCTTSTTCGDGWLDASEQCDYCEGLIGTATPGAAGAAGGAAVTKTCPVFESAACNHDCTVPWCGDGKVNHTAGEQCDTSGGADSDVCNGTSANVSLRCKSPACGDGYKNLSAGEQCDVSGGADSATCNGTSAGPVLQCKTPICGDGYKNVAAGEQCDVVGGADLANCNGVAASALLQCKTPLCGDGYPNLAAGEQCDVPGGSDALTCNGTAAGASLKCKTPICGDGYINKAANEECDPGVNGSIAGCSDRCKVVPGWDCHADSIAGPSACTPICGDGLVLGVEVCDDGLGCGTCNDSCNSDLGVKWAAGTIKATKVYATGTNIYSTGDTFTLDDGVRSKTFEFRLDDSPSPVSGRVVIALYSNNSGYQVAAMIANAVNGVGQALAITASINATYANYVDLTNDNPGGGLRNTSVVVTGRIATWSEPYSFVNSNIQGGIGYDCNPGVSCGEDADCASAVCCLAAGTPSNCTPANLHKCLASTCTDGKQNGTETGIDCGGGSCVACSNGQPCVLASDCLSGNCNSAGNCAAAS